MTAARRHRGFTLIELLLVLALLAVLAAAAWPSVLRVYGDFELKQAAADVRAKLAATRIRAIDNGVPYQFLYQPEGRRFLIAPQELPPVNKTGTNAAVQAAPLWKALGELPNDLRFQPLLSIGVSQKAPSELVADLPDATGLSGVTWASPILFLPDGSTVDAVFRLVDAKRQGIEISVRGLTGAVTVSPVLHQVDGR